MYINNSLVAICKVNLCKSLSRKKVTYIFPPEVILPLKPLGRLRVNVGQLWPCFDCNNLVRISIHGAMLNDMTQILYMIFTKFTFLVLMLGSVHVLFW